MKNTVRIGQRPTNAYVLLCTYGLCYYCCCCTVCTALLFSYSAIFIAASVRNKLIHSFNANIVSRAAAAAECIDGVGGAGCSRKSCISDWRQIYFLVTAAHRDDDSSTMQHCQLTDCWLASHATSASRTDDNGPATGRQVNCAAWRTSRLCLWRMIQAVTGDWLWSVGGRTRGSDSRKPTESFAALATSGHADVWLEVVRFGTWL